MPIDGSIPLQAHAPSAGDTLQNISSLLGIKRQQQVLQTGQYQQQTEQAGAQQAQQDMQERNAATSILQNPQQYGILDENGVIDPAKAIPLIQKAAPKTNGLYVAPIMQGFKAQLEVSKAAQDLNRSMREDANSALSSVATNQKATYGDIVDAADLLKEQNPKSAKFVDAMLSHLNPQEPMEVTKQKLISFGRVILPPSSTVGPQGLATPQTASIDTGASIQPGAVQPQTGAFTPSGSPIKKELPPLTPGVLTDANGRQFRLDPNTNTVAPIGEGTSPKQTSTAPRFVQKTADQEQVTHNIESARQAGDQVGLNSHINDQLLKLSKDTATGPGTETWHHVMGALGAPFGTNASSDYQTIGAYLDRQAAINATAMGLPNTNAGMASSQSLTGNTGYTPKALQTKIILGDALNTAAGQFRKGLDRAVGVGSNQDASKYQAFRSAWAENFDPRIFMVENAIKRGDTEELAILKKDIGPKAMADLKKKSANLRKLENGELPE